MTRVYRGIDIAGDKSDGTGVADLVMAADDSLTVRLPDGPWDGTDGLRRMPCVGRDETLAGCAVDQPFGFPAATLALLNNEPLPRPPAAADEWRYRSADLAMRRRLAELGLVLPPRRQRRGPIEARPNSTRLTRLPLTFTALVPSPR